MHFGEEVAAHGSIGVLPVAEAITIVVWVAAEVDDDTHEDEADEGNNLYGAEPELELAEYADTKEVDEKD